jgi:uncharacterized membrane protein YdjX (TVP38/TMEM64 family)
MRWVRRARIAAVVSAVTVVVVAQRLGLFDLTSDPARLKQALLDLGPWGYAAFLGAYTVFQPFGVPGTVFVVAAPLIWPFPIAFALSMAGTMSASVVGFSFARFVARDWVARMVPARFHAYDEALERRAFLTVFTLRLIFWMPPLLHAFFGVSRVRFSTHFWGSAAGYVLPLLATSYFGPRVFDLLRTVPPAAWAGTAVAAVVIALVTWAVRRRGARSASSGRRSPSG